MLTRASVILALLVCVAGLLLLFHRQSLRRASLINGMNALRVAYSDYLEHGRLTNHATSGWRVWPFTNVFTIDGTQHQCFGMVGGGYGYGICTLAMSTNRVFIWIDPDRSPRIITSEDRPSLLSGRY